MFGNSVFASILTLRKQHWVIYLSTLTKLKLGLFYIILYKNLFKETASGQIVTNIEKQ